MSVAPVGTGGPRLLPPPHPLTNPASMLTARKVTRHCAALRFDLMRQSRPVSIGAGCRSSCGCP